MDNSRDLAGRQGLGQVLRRTEMKRRQLGWSARCRKARKCAIVGLPLREQPPQRRGRELVRSPGQA